MNYSIMYIWNFISTFKHNNKKTKNFVRTCFFIFTLLFLFFPHFPNIHTFKRLVNLLNISSHSIVPLKVSMIHKHA